MTDIPSLIVEAITAHDANRPRNLQRHVGPSDLGNPCDHCLAAKLAGWEKRPELAWLPYIGTAVHAQLADAFGVMPGWDTERSTVVGFVGGRVVDGTADLFHVPTRTVVDFKIVGVNTLKDAKAGRISEQYRAQVHLYGRGLEADHVAIAFLPRSAPDLRHMVYWTEPYDEAIVYRTLARADRLDLCVRVHQGVCIKDMDRAPGCYDCPRYPDWAAHCESLERKPSKSIMEGIMS